MELGKELYTTADHLYFPSNENKNMFLSVFLFQNFVDSISNFQDTLHPKARGYKSCILFSYATRLKVVKSKILDEGPVPKKAKVDFSTTF